jgi:hypothetical protein
MADYDFPKQEKLPSPDELMAKRKEIVDSAIQKLEGMGFTHDEALILTNSYYLFG